MKKQNIFWVLAFLFLAACGSKSEKIQLPGSPLVFHLEKLNKPDIFATYGGGEVTRAQILDQNPVQEDLKTQESLIRLEYILRKFTADAKSADTILDIFI